MPSPLRLVALVPLAACFTQPPGSDATSGGPHDDADTDEPVGATDTLGGEYAATLRTLSCTGDCTGPQTVLGAASYCDVGASSSDVVDVAHDDMTLVIDATIGRLTGTIDDGAFHVTGKSTRGGNTIAIDLSADGSFTGRHQGFTAVVRYDANGDDVDCHGEIEVTAEWSSDGCLDQPESCPDAYPYCVGDGCYAGDPGDPCRNDDDCGEGVVCGVEACAVPGQPGDPCIDANDCAADLHCIEQSCNAGEPGDRCYVADDCIGGFCVEGTCSAGAVGDACNASWDCAAGFCVDELCRDGAPGSPCTYDGDCTGSICVDALCRAGTAGDPCDFDDDCARGFTCEGTTCAG